MALLNRFSKLNDRGETGIFTFIVTKSVTRDFHRDATTKDFCFGYHRWAISFQRPTDKMLGVHLLLRNASPNTACVVDFTLALLNREHFSQNLFYSKRQAKFTITNPMQGVSRWIELAELTERKFSNETGEFLFELSLSNMTTIFECDIQLSPSILNQYKHLLKFGGQQPQPQQQQQQQHASGKSNGNGTNNKSAHGAANQLINLETNNFTFGSFEWSLTIVPLVVASGGGSPSTLAASCQNSSSASSSQDSFDQLASSSSNSKKSSHHHQKSPSSSTQLQHHPPAHLEPVCRVYLNRLSGFDSLCRVKYRVILGHHQPGNASQSAEFVDSKQLDQISDCDGRIRGHQFRHTNVLKLISLRHGGQSGQSNPSSGGNNHHQQPTPSKRNSGSGLGVQQQPTSQSQSSLDLRVHIEMFCANTISEARVPITRSPNEPQTSNCSDRNKQAWCVESDNESGDLLKLKLFFMDLQSVPRNHIRYISWIAHLVRRDPKTGQTRDSLAVRNSPHSNYYLQDGIDMGAIMETDVQVEELNKSPKSFLEGQHLTVHIEWIDSLLLFSHLYNNYDALATIQRHQISRELFALQQEFDYLEGKYLQAQRTLNRLASGGSAGSGHDSEQQQQQANKQAHNRSQIGRRRSSMNGGCNESELAQEQDELEETDEEQPNQRRQLVLELQQQTRKSLADAGDRDSQSQVEEDQLLGAGQRAASQLRLDYAPTLSAIKYQQDEAALALQQQNNLTSDQILSYRISVATKVAGPRCASSLSLSPDHNHHHQQQRQNNYNHPLSGRLSGGDLLISSSAAAAAMATNSLTPYANLAVSLAAPSSSVTASSSMQQQASFLEPTTNSCLLLGNADQTTSQTTLPAISHQMLAVSSHHHHQPAVIVDGSPGTGGHLGLVSAAASTSSPRSPSVRRRLPQPKLASAQNAPAPAHHHHQRDRPSSALADSSTCWLSAGSFHTNSTASHQASSSASIDATNHLHHQQQQQHHLGTNESLRAATSSTQRRESPARLEGNFQAVSSCLPVATGSDGLEMDNGMAAVGDLCDDVTDGLAMGSMQLADAQAAATTTTFNRFLRPRHSADSPGGVRAPTGSCSPKQQHLINASIRDSPSASFLQQHELAIGASSSKDNNNNQEDEFQQLLTSNINRCLQQQRLSSPSGYSSSEARCSPSTTSLNNNNNNDNLHGEFASLAQQQKAGRDNDTDRRHSSMDRMRQQKCHYAATTACPFGRLEELNNNNGPLVTAPADERHQEECGEFGPPSLPLERLSIGPHRRQQQLLNGSDHLQSFMTTELKASNQALSMNHDNNNEYAPPASENQLMEMIMSTGSDRNSSVDHPSHNFNTLNKQDHYLPAQSGGQLFNGASGRQSVDSAGAWNAQASNQQIQRRL